MNHSDKISKLVKKAIKRNPTAWEELYKLTFKPAYLTAIRITGTEQDATDLVHDAFVSALEKIDQLSNHSTFQAWLNAVVANKCRDYLKKKKPLLFSEMAEDDSADLEWIDDNEQSQPELMLDRQETSHLINEIIGQLPEDQLLCVTMYYRDNFNVRQIASSLEVSEGTVKSRLNYAREKIRTKVLELEKNGTKLYALSPVPMIIWLLKKELYTAAIPSATAIAPAISIGAPITQTASASAGTISTALLTKVIAGLVAISVIAGTAVVFNELNNTTPDDTTPHQSTQSSQCSAKQEAIAVYEALLTQGFTDSGLKIAYYEYLDLDQDSIPELLVSDADGTPQSWSVGELFTYHDNTLSNCGSTNSQYDYFYIANKTYLLGRHRMGNQYISKSEVIKTYSYYWNDDYTCNAPAIERKDRSIEYITQDQFDYYNNMPQESPSTERFIQTAEPITLKKNTSYQPNVIQETLDFSKAWSAIMQVDGEYFHSCFVFENPGTLYYTLSYADSMQPTYAFDLYKGTFSVEENTITIVLGYSLESGEQFNQPITYLFDAETLSLTQISDHGLFGNHKKGHMFQLSEDQWSDAKRIKSFFSNP